MAVDLSPIDEELLAALTDIHGIPQDAYNIRKDGQLVSRSSSANITIETKTDHPGIDIHFAPGTHDEKV
ncbi:MAG: ABC transporter permease, partial [Eggerthellales bacterium]|nr:ABC transporter permease [Eggerthellales bacterium]